MKNQTTKNWIYRLDDKKHPINHQLLTGGKKILNTLYKYTPQYTTGEDVSYLPSSYSQYSDYMGRSNYQHHNVQSFARWQEDNYDWVCKDFVGQDQIERPNGFICCTDCSGFVTSLFGYCNQVGKVPTAFGTTQTRLNYTKEQVESNHIVQWELEALKKANDKVPDLDNTFPVTLQYGWKPAQVIPVASSFYEMIAKEEGFKCIKDPKDMLPGDIITYNLLSNKNPNNDNVQGIPDDTGHIMLIVALRKISNQALSAIYGKEITGETSVYEIIVLDESKNQHTNDTRKLVAPDPLPENEKHYQGLGMGIATVGLFKKDDTESSGYIPYEAGGAGEGKLVFFFEDILYGGKDSQSHPPDVPVMIGRGI